LIPVAKGFSYQILFMKILCVGEALIDMICTDVGSSLRDGQQFLKKAGGAPANVAAATAALGSEVELVAKVGADPFGNHIDEVLKEFGVGTSLLFRDKDHFTTIAFVSLMQNGERDFYFNRGADGELTTAEVDEIDVGQFSIVHFGSATAFLPGPLQSSYAKLLDKCLQQDIFISFDPNYRQLLYQNGQQSFVEQSWNFLKSCHFYKLSDEEACLITGKKSVEEAASMLLSETKAVFAITLGKEGTMLGINNATQVIRSIPVKPVDTTGAGDAFVGAVLHQLAAGKTSAIDSLSEDDWKKVVYNANKAGARTCEYMGAMEAFKHLSNSIFE
jgi:fructokinase